MEIYHRRNVMSRIEKNYQLACEQYAELGVDVEEALRRVAAEHGVEMLGTHRSKEALSVALGRLCGVLAVEDKGFAGKLRTMITNEQGGEFYD